MKNLRRNLIIGLALAAGLYFIMGLYVSFGDLAAALAGFQWWLLLPALGLVAVNYGVRFIKWEYLLRAIGIRVPLRPSFVIFVSGLTMTISPAKMGEVLKSFMLKEHVDVPVRRSAPVVMAERATDVIGVVLLGGAGTLAYGFGREVLAVTLALTVLFIGLVQHRRLCLRLLRFAEKLPLVRRVAVHLEEFYEGSYVLLKARRLVPAVALSTVGWFCECVAAWLCLQGLGVDLSLWLVTFIFVIASLAGALAMIPGGLGVAEGSMAGMLITSGVAAGPAVAGTLIIRLVTFWFAILLGLGGIAAYGVLHSGKIGSGNSSEEAI